jgi:deazaflavin-dependent oxidoreductase (nitroreductase family)
LAGAPKNPKWVGNLRANPRATLRRGKTAQPVRAKEVRDGAERDRLWRLVSGAFPLYETYQKRTKRQFPLFVLESVADG